jgi:hypothetical protein
MILRTNEKDGRTYEAEFCMKQIKQLLVAVKEFRIFLSVPMLKDYLIVPFVQKGPLFQYVL